MSRLQQFFGSTIGLKMVMAVTGVVWIGYVIAHMLGNLQIFAGRAAINDYSKFLHDAPALLWTARAVLIVSLVAHVAAYLKLTRTNLGARPQPYARRRDVATSFAARTMAWTGPILLVFIVYHVLHLTLQVTPDVALDAHDVYSNLVNSFQMPWLVLVYLVGLAALGFHLFHGAWSFFQTLGANHPQWNPLRRRFAILVAVVVVVGFLAVPLSILAGIVRPANDLAVRTTASTVLAD